MGLVLGRAGAGAGRFGPWASLTRPARRAPEAAGAGCRFRGFVLESAHDRGSGASDAVHRRLRQLRRGAAWISPIRLFLLANLLYFLAPVLTDLSLSLHNQVRGEAYRQLAPERCVEPAADPRCTWGGQMHSRFTEPVFLRTLERERARAEARGRRFDPTAFEYRYNARSEAIGKLLVIVHVPFLALALALLAWRRRLYYAEHFVVALGLVTFVLLLVPLGVSPLAWLYALLQRTLGLSGGSVASILGYAALAVVLLHFAQACRRCYGSRWPTAALQGLLAFVALGATSLLVYRPLQFLLALWTL